MKKLLYKIGIWKPTKTNLKKVADDQDFLFRIVQRNSSKAIRKEALEFIHSQDLLYKIVLENNFKEIKSLAIKKIKDEILLFNLFPINYQSDFKDYIISKLTDLTLLVDLYLSKWVSSKYKQKISEKIGQSATREDVHLIQKILNNETDFITYIQNSHLLIDLYNCSETKIKPSILKHFINKKYIDNHFLNDPILQEVDLTERQSYIKNLIENSVIDQEMLIKIALEDSHFSIRILAIKNLIENSVIDQEMLTKIALQDPHFSVRMLAIKNINDIKGIENELLLDKSQDIRFLVTRNINDQNILKQLVKNDPSVKVRTEAVTRISDTRFLQKTLKKETDANMRLLIAIKLGQEDIIAQIAMNEELEWALRRRAARNLNDEEQLANVTIKDNYWKYFWTPAEKDLLSLFNEKKSGTGLRERDESFDYLRRITFKKISRPEFIVKVLIFRKDDYVLIEQGLNQLHINDLKYVVLKSKNKYTARMALAKISDKHALFDIAKDGNSYELNKIALEGIFDQNLISILAKKAKKKAVRNLAIKKIKNEIFLQELLTDESDENLRLNILKRINNLKSKRK